MDERYQIAENKCLEKVLDAAFKGWEDMDSKVSSPEVRRMKDQLVSLLTHTIKVAFADGYDIGYCNGVDDIKDID